MPSYVATVLLEKKRGKPTTISTTFLAPDIAEATAIAEKGLYPNQIRVIDVSRISHDVDKTNAPGIYEQF